MTEAERWWSEFETYSGLALKHERERDQARCVARCLADFFRAWDGLSEVRSDLCTSPVKTLEFDLYCKAVVADELLREVEWLKEEM